MINAQNPIQVTDQGTWKWNAKTGMAEFTATPNTNPTPAGTMAIPNQAAFNMTGLGGTGSINLNTLVSSTRPLNTVLAQPPKPPPTPTPPDYKNLNTQLSTVRRSTAIAQAMKEYDALAASTKAAGSQNANNAGTIYANRLMQQGVNPVSSGVVAAQAKLPLFQQLADINVAKQNTKLDATAKADALAAQIAQAIAGLQLGFTQTLADFNLKNTAYELDLNKFNAAQQTQSEQFEAQRALEIAKMNAALAASGGSGSARRGGASGDGYEGPLNYVPNSGPMFGGFGERHPAYNLWLKNGGRF